jgi:hypothetical protein
VGRGAVAVGVRVSRGTEGDSSSPLFSDDGEGFAVVMVTPSVLDEILLSRTKVGRLGVD